SPTSTPPSPPKTPDLGRVPSLINAASCFVDPRGEQNCGTATLASPGVPLLGRKNPLFGRLNSAVRPRSGIHRKTYLFKCLPETTRAHTHTIAAFSPAFSAGTTDSASARPALRGCKPSRSGIRGLGFCFLTL